MYPKHPRSPSGRLALVCALVSLGAVTLSTPAGATSTYLRNWRAAYPDSASDENLASPCSICHGEKYSQFNGYGWDFLENGYSFSAIEPLNSDGDPNGATNLQEINANTQPGWTEGANNFINGGLVSETALPAELLAGAVDIAAGNQPPVADIGGPYSGTEAIAVAFDASGSSDSDGSIASFAWDFGDGSSGSGAKLSHVYNSTGTFNVTLIVTDDAGEATAVSTPVTIGAGNQPPVADAKGPYSGVVGKTIQFDGSASSDADGSIVGYDWNFGDGTSGAKPSHSYASKGTYNITLTVTDDGNAVDSAVTTVSIDADNQAPTADAAGPYSAMAGEELVFDGTGSSDADGSISRYDWTSATAALAAVPIPLTPTTPRVPTTSRCP
jgi:PKD repeat protein